MNLRFIKYTMYSNIRNNFIRVWYFQIIFHIATSCFAGGSYIYLYPEYRQHNYHSSCVYASTTSCLRALHLFKKADKFWGKYGGAGGADSGDIDRALNKFNIKHKMLYHCDEKAIIAALNEGRPVAVTWGSRHMTTLMGYIDGNAYILDNNHTTKYIKQTWHEFLNNHRWGGGWAVVILDGYPSPPVEQKDLHGFIDSKFVP